MSREERSGPLRSGARLPSGRRLVELLFVALVMALLTLFIGDLPELEVIESTVNDDSFSDLLVTTRGELPIDTSIVVLTYGPEFLDDYQRIDRGLLAQGIAFTFVYEPAIVGVDFLIDDRRDEAQENDEMLAGVIGDYGDRLIFGLYSIDTLGRARPIPDGFNLGHENLATVNLMEGEDRVIRTFRPYWPGLDARPTPLLAVAVAERIDPDAFAYLGSFDAEEFVIDYAAGIGEHVDREDEDAAGLHVFPSIPLETVAEAVLSESQEDDEAMRRLIGDRAVLIGYADLRRGQVRSVVDRFYTPLKPEANALPDMHGVAIHANILNTILQRRIVTTVPVGVNVLWGTIIVFLMFFAYESFRGMTSERKRAILTYGAWGLLLFVTLFLPILLFRSTSWKLSVYTPFAGLILGRLVLGIYDRIRRFILDIVIRQRVRRLLPEVVRPSFTHILKTSDSRERYLAALHLLQRIFHTSIDRMFAAAASSDVAFSRDCVASPTPFRVLEDIDAIDDAQFAEAFAVEIDLVRQIDERPEAQRALRTARSLVIAVNEIARQQAMLEEEERLTGRHLMTEGNLDPFDGSDADAILVAASNADATSYEGSDRLIDELLTLAAGVSESHRDRILPTTEDVERAAPFIVRSRCAVHGDEEVFLYVSEQEDANNRDDYHDLVFAGATVRSRPETHPGLTEFRRRAEPAWTKVTPDEVSHANGRASVSEAPDTREEGEDT